MKIPNLPMARCILLVLMLLGRPRFTALTAAQPFTVLRSFGNPATVSGTQPGAQLVQGPDGFDGTTAGGSSGVSGTVYRSGPMAAACLC